MSLLGKGSFKHVFSQEVGPPLGKVTASAFLEERSDCYLRKAFAFFPELGFESGRPRVVAAWDDVVKQYMSESTTFASLLAFAFTCLHNEKKSPEQSRDWALRRLAIGVLLDDMDDETTDPAFFIAHDISSIAFAAPYRTGRRGQREGRYRELLGYINMESSATPASEESAPKHQQGEPGEREAT